MSESFGLHPQLAKDCFALGDFPLSRLLLMNDANYPWCILAPRRGGIREIHRLNDADRRQLKTTRLGHFQLDLRPQRKNSGTDLVPLFFPHRSKMA